MFDIDPLIAIFYGFLGLLGLGVFANAVKKIGIFAFILPAISVVSYGIAWIANYFQWSIYSAVSTFAYFWSWGWIALFGWLLVDKKSDIKGICDNIACSIRKEQKDVIERDMNQRTRM